MRLDARKNFAKVTVAAGNAAGVTSISLNTGEAAKLPPDPSISGNAEFNLTWWNITDFPDPNDDPSHEVVRVTAITVDVLTVTRAQESTSDVDHDTLTKNYAMQLGVTAKVIDDIETAIQTESMQFAVATGSPDAYLIVLDPPLSAYVEGMPITFRANFENTGPATADAGPGAKAIKKKGTSDLDPGDIVVDQIIQLAYDSSGDVLQLMSPSAGMDNFDNLSPNTTKGDITVHNGITNVRLPVGANETVPIADSAQSEGIRWTDNVNRVIHSLVIADLTINSSSLVPEGNIEWDQSRNTDYVNGNVIFNWTRGNRDLEVLVFNLDTFASLGTAIFGVGQDGHQILSFTIPTADALINIQLRKTANGGTSPIMHALHVEFD